MSDDSLSIGMLLKTQTKMARKVDDLTAANKVLTESNAKLASQVTASKKVIKVMAELVSGYNSNMEPTLHWRVSPVTVPELGAAGGGDIEIPESVKKPRVEGATE